MDVIRPEQDYQRFLDEGRFMIQRERSSGRYVFYPRVAEPRTGSTNLEWVEASGKGTVYAVTVVRPAPPKQPYNVVLVDLAEGVRMMGRVDAIAPDAVRIGMAVKASVIRENDESFVVFHPDV